MQGCVLAVKEGHSYTRPMGRACGVSTLKRPGFSPQRTGDTPLSDCVHLGYSGKKAWPRAGLNAWGPAREVLVFRHQSTHKTQDPVWNACRGASTTRTRIARLAGAVTCALQDRRGVTALHVALIITPVAIVYVLFLLVSLTTGSKTSEDVVDNSVIKTRPSLDLNGSLITKSKDGAVDEIMFHVTNALGGMIDLSPDTTFASYTDPDQSLTFTGSELTVTGLRTANSDNLVEKGDLYEIRLTDLREKLEPDLTGARAFTIQLQPIGEGPLDIKRLTPATLDAVNDLG